MFSVLRMEIAVINRKIEQGFLQKSIHIQGRISKHFGLRGKKIRKLGIQLSSITMRHK